MLRFILFDTSLFAPGSSSERAQTDIMWLLEALTCRDQAYLADHPKAPRLYKSGVRYEAPKQFAGECEEAKVLREALGRAARKRDVAAALRTVQEVLGGERFRDIGRVLENGGGDCFPLSALLLRQCGAETAAVAAADVQRGDIIWGRGRWTAVQATTPKGVLPLDAIALADGASFRLTRDHKVFVVRDDRVLRVAVGQLEPGMQMLRGAPVTWLAWRAPHPENEWASFCEDTERLVSVHAIQRGVAEAACVDIQTEDHYVHLLEPNVLISNCDNLACWRTAELRQAGIRARAYMTKRQTLTGTVYHALTLWPPIPGVPYATSEDSSLLLGMGGASRAADRRLEIEKNQERCEHLARGGRGAFVDPLADVLGLHRRPGGFYAPDPALAAIEADLRLPTPLRRAV